MNTKRIDVTACWRGFRLAALAVCLASATGCLSGAIYRHTTEPFDLNLNKTPSHLGEATPEDRGESWKTLVIPLSLAVGGVDPQFDWGDMSVSTAMAHAGIAEVHYADLEIRSILGIWTQRWLLVYGE